MKRKMMTLFLTTVAIAVLTPSTVARPQYSTEYIFYDESGTGTQVGYWFQSCAGGLPYQEGQITNEYNLTMSACPWMFDPFPSCGDLNLQCTNCAQYCVTDSYYMSVVVMHNFSDPFGCL